MGRPPGSHSRNIFEGLGWVDFTASWGDFSVWFQSLTLENSLRPNENSNK